MARTIDERVIVTGRLVAESPLHIGGVGEDPNSDMPFIRDGRGRLFLPGSSLAGALRSWTWRRLGRPWAECPEDKAKQNRALLRHLWGYQPRAEDPLEVAGTLSDGDEGRAAALRLNDAPVLDDVFVEIRDGVGIDRALGVAADQIKYDRAIVPTGAAFDFRMVLETDGDRAHAKWQVLALLLDDLQNARVRIGAATTRGLGRVRLRDTFVETLDLTDRAIFLEALTRRVSGGKAETGRSDADRLKGLVEVAKAELLPSPLPWTICIHWQPVGPVMVKSDAEGTAVDMLPLTTQVDGGPPRLVIPGSSVKGVLRAQAERIVRTVLADDRCDDAQNSDNLFLEQVKVPLVMDLFGIAAPRKGEGGQAQGGGRDRKPGRGALGVADCVAETVFDADVLSGQTERTGSGSTRHSQLKPTMHVAIDRWTGGAAEHFLYSVLEPHGVEWPPIDLTLDPARLPDDSATAALALLLLTLNDLVLGRLTLGFAGNRGMGEVKIEKVEIDWTEGLLAMKPGETAGTLTLNGSDLLAVLDETVRASLKTGWSDWIEKECAA